MIALRLGISCFGSLLAAAATASLALAQTANPPASPAAQPTDMNELLKSEQPAAPNEACKDAGAACTENGNTLRKTRPPTQKSADDAVLINGQVVPPKAPTTIEPADRAPVPNAKPAAEKGCAADAKPCTPAKRATPPKGPGQGDTIESVIETLG